MESFRQRLTEFGGLGGRYEAHRLPFGCHVSDFDLDRTVTGMCQFPLQWRDQLHKNVVDGVTGAVDAVAGVAVIDVEMGELLLL